MELLISNQQDIIAVDEEFLDFCRNVLENAWKHISAEEGTISVVFVDNDTIASLNEHYRHVDGPTDVLSFPLKDDILEQAMIGELVISLPRAKEQSETYEHALAREVAFLLVHGLLHLAGYDHDKQNDGLMRQKEKEIMGVLGISREQI